MVSSESPRSHREQEHHTEPPTEAPVMASLFDNANSSGDFDSNSNNRYLIISSLDPIRGPTVCGDHESDPNLMELLGAKLPKEGDSGFSQFASKQVFVSPNCPREVLNLLASVGYSLVSTGSNDQTGFVWTLKTS